MRKVIFLIKLVTINILLLIHGFTFFIMVELILLVLDTKFIKKLLERNLLKNNVIEYFNYFKQIIETIIFCFNLIECLTLISEEFKYIYLILLILIFINFAINLITKKLE